MHIITKYLRFYINNNIALAVYNYIRITGLLPL